ncbi:MAG: preprotein translocase subunit SecE [Defluviitaleaceae bacterium]|nr:preprotein translocase subunit SecE [Defluviitaleaceae bacterium]
MDDKNKTADKGSTAEAASSWWGGLVGEFKRISWPTKEQIAKMTIAAIVVSGIVAAIITGYDLLLGFLHNGLINLVG